MAIAGSRAEVKIPLDSALQTYSESGSQAFIDQFHIHILKKKIRFPVLEYIGRELHRTIPLKEQIGVTDEIIKLGEIGGNVIAGIILQFRLENHFKESVHKALEYIASGDQWYVCDIIGERVLGHALLTQPEKTIPLLKKFTTHSDKWIVRSVGVATHYAVKKGLPKSHSDQSFQILLSCSTVTDFHTKKGIGWAVKTMAKFHPDIIKKYEDRIQKKEVKQWFRTKLKIGLSRAFKYAAKYPG